MTRDTDRDPLDRYAAQLREQAMAEAQGDPTRRGSLEDLVAGIVARVAPALSPRRRRELVERVVVSAAGLGPLEPLLADSEVDEIMVNGTGAIWTERRGRLALEPFAVETSAELRALIERIVAPLGRRVDESSPVCDGRLPDGSRVCVVIPPLSLDGPLITIRRFRHAGLGPAELVARGTLSPRALAFLGGCVSERVSLLVSGGTGSGKTTMLNALSRFIAAGERIVTIEDAAELRLRQEHVVRLESRPPNLEGRGEVTIRDLVRTALRMRPDRIVVGEVRGGEALDMLAALNTGHDGGMTTVHAGSPEGALARVETLALMAGVDIPFEAVARQVASAIGLVVHQERIGNGSRAVTRITEVVVSDGGYELHDVYRPGSPGHPDSWKAPVGEKLREIHEAAASP